ncbi:hypothetical protein, partial [Kocuria palustris]|uniref:hypothetical protein n=1 Tax=Kocuria palustris TaxID=71999 RepID=UPI00331D30DD
GDLSTVSGLIGQRSCGNVVVRGVNDVVTQDTPSSADGKPLRSAPALIEGAFSSCSIPAGLTARP